MTDPLALSSTLAPDYLDRDEIALRAYAIWQGRGCPAGSAEQDWLDAEHELRRERVTRLDATQLFAPPTADGLEPAFPVSPSPVATMADSSGAAPKRRRRPTASAVSGAIAGADPGTSAAPAPAAPLTRKRPARPDA